MIQSLPTTYLVRHGETAWSLSGQHTGRTDLPLTARGEQDALRLGARLRGLTVKQVFTSPLQRAARTCALAGFGDLAKVDDDLMEWDYGRYEGLRTADILAERPGWELFRDGCPGGETPAQVGKRVDRVIARVRELRADVLLFSSGHVLRALGARWLGLDVAFGRFLALNTVSVSGLGYEHSLAQPVICLWNESCACVAAKPDHEVSRESSVASQ